MVVEDSLTTPAARSVWFGWGDPTQHRPRLGARGWAFLERAIDLPRGEHRPPVPIESVRLPDRHLAPAALTELAHVVGSEHVHSERLWRVEHAGGKGYPDLARIRSGDGSAAPDVVAVPATPSEVAGLLKVCDAHRLAVVPFGGGTSVVGGVDALDPTTRGLTGVVAIDLRRLNRVLSVDAVSRTATLQPGLRGFEAERALRPHGLTLGHYPQSHQRASIGGYLATRSAGQASTAYGRIDANVLGVRVATPRGELVLGGRSPASAVGPRLIDLVLGSEGTLGLITEATVAVCPMPMTKRYAAWAFPSFAAGAQALRHLVQDVGRDTMPAVCRLSDETESRANLLLAGRSGEALLRWARLRVGPTPAVLVLIWEGGHERLLRQRQAVCESRLRSRGGRRLPRAVSTRWEKSRFAGPYLRDQLMDRAAFVETIETATSWTNLLTLHAKTAFALRSTVESQGRQALVMCHISHLYPTGASLYYTVIAPQAPDPVAQWQTLKETAVEAVLSAGGTLSHHHGVGTHHRHRLVDEIGPLGIDLLRAAKAELDPNGILNPGKLIPDP